MSPHRDCLLAIGLALLLITSSARVVVAQGDSHSKPSPPDALRARSEQLHSAHAPAYVENRGQWDRQARFMLAMNGMNVWVTDRGVVYDIYQDESGLGYDDGASTSHSFRRMNLAQPDDGADEIESAVGRSTGHVVRLTFEGSRSGAVPQGMDRRSTYHNYFIGNDRERWATHVPLFNGVRTEDLYEGIDALFYTDQGQPRYDLVVHAGADPSQVRIRCEGADEVTVSAEGTLRIETSVGPIEHRDLFAYQIVDGERQQVACSFMSHPDGAVGFMVGEYDRTRELIIDPLIYSTVLGSSYRERSNGIAVDAEGMIYVAGHTRATTFPATPGAYDLTHNEDEDVYTAKLDPSATGASQLVYFTYLGGSRTDLGNDIEVDRDGYIYLTGDTYGTSTVNYPVTADAFDTTHPGGGYDVFVTKLDPSAVGVDQLVFSTYLEGGLLDQGRAIAVDDDGFIYVTGGSQWDQRPFPTTAGAFDRTPNGDLDAFIVKLDPFATGQDQLVYGTLLGGQERDRANGIAVDKEGYVYLTGGTYDSKYVDFPTTPGAYDTGQGGGEDIFIAMLDVSAEGEDQLVYSTFVGAGIGHDITIDDSSRIYVTGQAGGGSLNYPTTPGAFQTTFGGFQDAFMLKLDPRLPGLEQLCYSTFIGGAAYEAATGIVLDDEGRVYVVGHTGSHGLPVTRGGFDTAHGPKEDDAFIMKIDPSASGKRQLVYSSFIGGEGYDLATDVALDDKGDIYVTGYGWQSLDFPITEGAFGKVVDTTSVYGFITALRESYAVTASSIGKGTVIPNGIVVVDRGGSAMFTMTPEPNEAIIDVLVDSTSVGAITSYTFTGLQADATLDVLFTDTSSSVDQVSDQILHHLVLEQHDVSADEVTISYELSDPTRVSLSIYSADGRLVSRPLLEASREAGSHRLVLDIGSLSSGVHYVLLSAGSQSHLERFVVLR